MDQVAQVILVSRSGSHEDVVAAVVKASLAAYTTPSFGERRRQDAWERWLSTRFTKSVRTVKSDSHLDRALQWAQDEGADAAEAAVGDARAVALSPEEVASLPKFIRSARVSGLERERTTPAPASTMGQRLLVLDSLTTGKAAAQAAHAAWMLSLHGGLTAETGPAIEFVPASVLEAASGLSVVDAGLTEIAPGTLTAKAVTGN